MTWKTHQAAALGATLFLSNSWVLLLASLFGAILPDIVDQRLAGAFSLRRSGRQKRFAKLHRGISHFFGLWLCLLWLCQTHVLFLRNPFFSDCLLGLSLGALLHVIFDALTPKGVPLLPFCKKPRLAVPLCPTGSIGEWLLFFFLLLFCAVFVAKRFFPSFALHF